MGSEFSAGCLVSLGYIIGSGKKKQKIISSTGIEPVTFRYMIFQLQPNVIANYTTRSFIVESDFDNPN